MLIEGMDSRRGETQKEMIQMSLQEFIRLEAKALSVLKDKDPDMLWKAIECGVAEKMRIYAETQNYDVNLNDLISVMWTELCCQASKTDHDS